MKQYINNNNSQNIKNIKKNMTNNIIIILFIWYLKNGMI